MKRFLFFILLSIISIPKVFSAANHVAGEEIYYKRLHDSTYRVFLVLYGTCDSASYNDLYRNNPSAQVFVIDSITNTTYAVMGLHRYSALDSVDVSPYCTGYTNSCNNPASQWPGYVRYVYSDTIVMPYRSAKWCFFFSSAMGASCSNPVARNFFNNYNFAGPANQNIALYATLNNKIGPNSSPTYVIQPLFDVSCPNVESVYAQTSTDPDNDSLDYSFAVPIVDINNDCLPASYKPLSNYPVGGFSYASPLPGGSYLDIYTGQLDFGAPGNPGNYLVAFRVSEYRNGILVGTSTRERIFTFHNKFCALHAPATGHIDVNQYHNAVHAGFDSVFVCPGNTVGLQIPVSDSFGDSVTVYLKGAPANAIVTVTNNSSPNPIVHFSWNTSGVAYGLYTFTLYYRAKGCPATSIGTGTYTIIVEDGGLLGTSILSETHCIYKAKFRLEVQNGGLPYNLLVTHGTDTVKRYTDTAVYTFDSLAAGNYIVYLFTKGRPCPSYVNLEIPDNGQFPYQPTNVVSPVEYCRDGKDTALFAQLSHNAQYFVWYDPSDNIIPGPVVPSTLIAGTYYYTVLQMYKTCESAKDTIKVIIDSDVCNYDAIVHNAITPNGDGYNDIWVVENIQYYPDNKVQVFDKLGDKVYEQERYMNTWNGGSVPSGVYYYVVDLGKPNISTGKQKYTGFLLIKR